MGRAIKNLIGAKEGKLTVIEFDSYRGRRGYFWKATCECGRVIAVNGHTLKQGHCGCEFAKRPRLGSEFYKGEFKEATIENIIKPEAIKLITDLGFEEELAESVYNDWRKKYFTKDRKQLIVLLGQAIGIEVEEDARVSKRTKTYKTLKGLEKGGAGMKLNGWHELKVTPKKNIRGEVVYTTKYVRFEKAGN